jgi:hypothetical protein
MSYILLSLLLICGYIHSIEGQTNPDQIIKNLEARMFGVELLPANIAKQGKVKTCTIISNDDDNKGNFYGEINYNKAGFCTNFWQTATTKLGTTVLGVFIKRDSKHRVVEIRQTTELSDTSALNKLLANSNLDANKSLWNQVHSFKYTPQGNLKAYTLLRVPNSLQLITEKLYYNDIDSLSKVVRTESQGDNTPIDFYVDTLIYSNSKIAERVYYKNSTEQYKEVFSYPNDFQSIVRQIRNGKESSSVVFMLDKRGRLQSKTTIIANLNNREEKTSYTYSHNRLKCMKKPYSTKTIYYTPKGITKKIVSKEEQVCFTRKWKYKKQLPVSYQYSVLDKKSGTKTSKVKKYSYIFFEGGI